MISRNSINTQEPKIRRYSSFPVFGYVQQHENTGRIVYLSRLALELGQLGRVDEDYSRASRIEKYIWPAYKCATVSTFMMPLIIGLLDSAAGAIYQTAQACGELDQMLSNGSPAVIQHELTFENVKLQVVTKRQTVMSKACNKFTPGQLGTCPCGVLRSNDKISTMTPQVVTPEIGYDDGRRDWRVVKGQMVYAGDAKHDREMSTARYSRFLQDEYDQSVILDIDSVPALLLPRPDCPPLYMNYTERHDPPKSLNSIRRWRSIILHHEPWLP
nr:hypothetical protein CFP56_20575 [Quercus suber]